MCLWLWPELALLESAYARSFRPNDQHFTPLGEGTEAVDCTEATFIPHCAHARVHQWCWVEA